MSEESTGGRDAVIPTSGGALVVRDPHGRFTKGSQPIQRGRVRGSRNFTTELLRAIRNVEKTEGKEFLIHVLQRAFKSDQVMVKVLDKLVADKSKEVSSPEPIVINVVEYYKVEKPCAVNESST